MKENADYIVGKSDLRKEHGAWATGKEWGKYIFGNGSSLMIRSYIYLSFASFFSVDHLLETVVQYGHLDHFCWCWFLYLKVLIMLFQLN